MNIFKKITSSITDSLLNGYTVHGISLAVSIGMYIAFSPFAGLHGVMILASAFLFGLHLPTVFLVASLNNPWTMIPFYSFDYILGYALVHDFFNLHPTLTFSAHSLDNYWPSLANTLSKCLGSGSICVWSFLVGGNVAGIIAALACYPLVKKLLHRKHSNIKQS
ncbi:DUF2062 domain-containing protein [Candidatus Dependentiae bacterium]|nr:DUF2062 domain-containing protein [Candidatus Dependentiae bacterium]